MCGRNPMKSVKLKNPVVVRPGSSHRIREFFNTPLLVSGIIFLSAVATTRLWPQENACQKPCAAPCKKEAVVPTKAKPIVTAHESIDSLLFLPKSELAKYNMLIMEVPMKKLVKIGNIELMFRSDALSTTVFYDYFGPLEPSSLAKTAQDMLIYDPWPPLYRSHSETRPDPRVSPFVRSASSPEAPFEMVYPHPRFHGLLKVSLSGQKTWIVYSGWPNTDGKIADTVKVTALILK